MKRMLINATQPEELRVAIVDGQCLDNLDIERDARRQKKSNIYKGIVTRLEPSLEAAFVEYGANRHGFLPFKEIAREYLSEEAFKDGGRPSVKDGLSEGTEIIVQIEKEERGNKGAALTTFISLAGRYLVLMTNNPRAGGVSRRIEGEDRSELRDSLRGLIIPDSMGVIARTAGVGRSSEELQWDLDYQAEIWRSIKAAGDDKPAPFLIYQESNLIIRALRDNFNNDIGEILIDQQSVYEEAREFIEKCIPGSAKKLKYYQDTVPLFNRFQIEAQIESAFQREVHLPSGGAIVIDHTEALVSIDINSARATKGSDIEETATNTNLEAVDEIARQLRLRDLGGLIVIDFIDMMAHKNQRAVEDRLGEALKMDRARVQTNRISKFGLMEMSRQRLRPSLGESTQIVCPRCSGHRSIRSIESLALSVLRLMEEEAMKENTGRVVAQVPVDVSSYLLNEKRDNIAEIEARNQAHLLVIPTPAMETPHFHIERVRGSETEHSAYEKSSYELTFDSDAPYVPPETSRAAIMEVAAVNTVTPSTSAPIKEGTERTVESRASKGFFAKLLNVLCRASNKEKTEAADDKNPRRNGDPQYSRQRSGTSSSYQRSNNSRRRDRDLGRNKNSANPRRNPSASSSRPRTEPEGKLHESSSPSIDKNEAIQTTADERDNSSQRRSRRGGTRRRRPNNGRKPHCEGSGDNTKNDNSVVVAGDGQTTQAGSDTSNGTTENTATSTPTSSSTNVSSKQPSDFKSSVRSLASEPSIEPATVNNNDIDKPSVHSNPVSNPAPPATVPTVAEPCHSMTAASNHRSSETATPMPSTAENQTDKH